MSLLAKGPVGPLLIFTVVLADSLLAKGRSSRWQWWSLGASRSFWASSLLGRWRFFGTILRYSLSGKRKLSVASFAIPMVSFAFLFTTFSPLFG